MKDKVRRSIAFVAARVCGNQDFSSLFDQQEEKNFKFTCETHGINMTVYDVEENCELRGHCNEGVFTFFHGGAGQYLTCAIKIPEFSGYDYVSGYSYSGEVTSHLVTIYDNETNKYYKYLF